MAIFSKDDICMVNDKYSIKCVHCGISYSCSIEDHELVCENKKGIHPSYVVDYKYRCSKCNSAFEELLVPGICNYVDCGGDAYLIKSKEEKLHKWFSKYNICDCPNTVHGDNSVMVVNVSFDETGVFYTCRLPDGNLAMFRDYELIGDSEVDTCDKEHF